MPHAKSPTFSLVVARGWPHPDKHEDMSVLAYISQIRIPVCPTKELLGDDNFSVQNTMRTASAVQKRATRIL